MKTSLLFTSLALAFSLSTPAAIAAPVDAKGQIIATKDDDNIVSQNEMLSLAHLLGHLSESYVDPIPKKDFFKLMAQGILSKLDAHTSYLDPVEYKKFTEEMMQDYAGIGVTVSLPPSKYQGLMIEELFPGGPADVSGLRPGDVIVAVDAQPLDKTLEENVKLVRGPAGSIANLTILRDDKKILAPTSRAKIQAPSVFGSFCECSGANAYFIRITSFHFQTGIETAKQLLEASKYLPKSIILDLRDNSGGSLSASIEVASLLLPDDAVVVSSRQRGRFERFMGPFTPAGQKKYQSNGRSVEPLKQSFALLRQELNTAFPALQTLPVYTLVNASSASASEIVAAAMKDNSRGLLVGERTFGKGSVQSVETLPNGGALKITVARYYTPSGKSIQALGVEPDALVQDTRPWRLEVVERARTRYAEKAPKGFVREADLPRHLRESFLTLDELTAEEERKLALTLDDARPKANEPYERRFSYAPLGRDGKPDVITAKALQLSMKQRTPAASPLK